MRRRSEQSMEQRFLRTGAVSPPERRRIPAFVRFVAAGLGRLTLLVAAAAGISAGAGLLIGWWKGADLAHAANLGLYLGGATLVGVTLLTAGGQSFSSGEYEIREVETNPELRRYHQSKVGVYLVVGVLLLVLGGVFETLR